MLTETQSCALVLGVAIPAAVEWTWIIRTTIRIERLRRARGGR